MATQSIDLVTLADAPTRDISSLATTLTSTGTDNGFSIPAEQIKLIVLHNPTTSDATVILKSQTAPSSILLRYLEEVIRDKPITIEAGKTAFVKPHPLIVSPEGNIIIEADQLITATPLREWVIEI